MPPADLMTRTLDDSVYPWWPYVAPMAVFMALTWAEGQLPQSDGQPHPAWYPIAYAVKVVLVAAIAWAGRSAWRDLRPAPGPRGLGLAIAMGVAVAVGWVLLERTPYPRLPLGGGRQAFDPWTLPPAGRVAFLAVRFVGLVGLVPLIEELFWRSFLMRWIIDQDFLRVPVGQVTPAAGAITAAMFGLAHPEWLPALLTGLAWAWLLRKTGSLGACVISHAVANLGLGLYVVASGAWNLW